MTDKVGQWEDVPKNAGEWEDVAVEKKSKPRTYSMFSPQPDPKEEAAGYGEALKGATSGAAQTFTGLGELLPGQAGATSARMTQLLKGFGSPEAQTAGQLVTPLPLAKLLRGGKIAQEAPELLTRGKQALEAAKTGMTAGGIYGLAAPTGIEDTLERYKEKGISALVGVPTGGLLGGVFGAITATPTKSAADVARDYVREFVRRGFKGGESIEGLAATSDAVNKEIQRLTLRDISEALCVQRLHRAAAGHRRLEHLERRLAERLREVRQFEAEADVRLVDAVAVHRVLERHPRERPRDVHPEHILPDFNQHALEQRVDVLPRDERGLDVHLGELHLAIRPQVLVAEAAGDLEVAVKASDHQELLHLLRRLWQRVDTPLL